jgi:hypothetical protein
MYLLNNKNWKGKERLKNKRGVRTNQKKEREIISEKQLRKMKPKKKRYNGKWDQGDPSNTTQIIYYFLLYSFIKATCFDPLKRSSSGRG